MLKIVYSLLSCDLYAKCLADLKVESDRKKKKISQIWPLYRDATLGDLFCPNGNIGFRAKILIVRSCDARGKRRFALSMERKLDECPQVRFDHFFYSRFVQRGDNYASLPPQLPYNSFKLFFCQLFIQTSQVGVHRFAYRSVYTPPWHFEQQYSFISCFLFKIGLSAPSKVYSNFILRLKSEIF